MLVVGRRLGVGLETVGLIDHVGGDLLELVAVFAGVVGTEQQLTARLELNAEVGLGSATVAAVASAERCVARGKCSVHIGLISFICLGVLHNVAAGSKIPVSTWCWTRNPIIVLVPVKEVIHTSEVPIRGGRAILALRSVSGVELCVWRV